MKLHEGDVHKCAPRPFPTIWNSAIFVLPKDVGPPSMPEFFHISNNVPDLPPEIVLIWDIYGIHMYQGNELSYQTLSRLSLGKKTTTWSVPGKPPHISWKM